MQLILIETSRKILPLKSTVRCSRLQINALWDSQRYKNNTVAIARNVYYQKTKQERK